MKKVFTVGILALCAIFIVAGCGKGKPKVFEVKDMVSYTDDSYNFTIKYPGNWMVVPGSQKFVVFTDQASSLRFKEYTDKGTAGAKIELSVAKLGGDTTIESIMKKKVLPVEYSQPEKVTIGGEPGYKQTYKHTFSDGEFEGEIYYTTKDTKLATILSFEAFGGTLKEYRKTFDDILANIKLAVMPQAGMSQKVDTIIQERPFPSETMKSEKGEGFSIMIPDNFQAVAGTTGKDIIKSYKYIGERRLDCTIQVDLLDTKGNTIEVVTNGFHGVFPGAGSISNTTLGGIATGTFSFAPDKEHSGKLYLTVMGNKCYRTAIVWFKGEQEHYMPIFEKCVKSIKF